MQVEMDGEGAGAGSKSQFGGSNKRARTAAGSQWDSQVFSDDEAEADVRTKLGAATLAGGIAQKPRTAGMITLIALTLTVLILMITVIRTTAGTGSCPRFYPLQL